MRRVGRLQLIHCNVLTYLPAWVGVSVLDFVDHKRMSVEFFLSQSGLQFEIRLPELYTWPTRLGVRLAES